MAKCEDVVPVKKTNLPAPEALKASLATAKTTGDLKPVHTAAKALKAAAKVAGNRHARDMLDDLERELVPVTAEASAQAGKALNAKLAEEHEKLAAKSVSEPIAKQGETAPA